MYYYYASKQLTPMVMTLDKQLALLLENKAEELVEKKFKDESSDDEKPKSKRVSIYILFSNATCDENKNPWNAK